ncbi:hypothetical protein Pcinc_004478 [Petrolisthes cinctipes]|uniref:Uncharacterized protein n=1 Tax=Petrolisthes cinctipes TaxID=88211 RepID=A0AAE1GGX9_PETCI|nr:hypothetical protein Pcinc_004478 [Petrolisthes cinctipes]
MDGKLVALCPVSTDTSRLRQDVNVVLCQDTSENESTNFLCKTKPVAESSLQELKSSSATTAITKTEEVGWDPNHLILPSQSSYLHQDNLALRST